MRSSHTGAIKVERRYDFLPRLHKEQGLVAGVGESAPCDRSELSFATTPESCIPRLEDEVWMPSESDIQIANADLRQLEADGFAVN